MKTAENTCTSPPGVSRFKIYSRFGCLGLNARNLTQQDRVLWTMERAPGRLYMGPHDRHGRHADGFAQ
jgi:hypothetical protein